MGGEHRTYSSQRSAHGTRKRNYFTLRGCSETRTTHEKPNAAHNAQHTTQHTAHNILGNTYHTGYCMRKGTDSRQVCRWIHKLCVRVLAVLLVKTVQDDNLARQQPLNPSSRGIQITEGDPLIFPPSPIAPAHSTFSCMFHVHSFISG